MHKEGYNCSTWFERDRAHIRLEAADGACVFELWDEEVADAIESGYLPRPRAVRPNDIDWLQSALAYAEARSLFAEEVVAP